MIQRPRALLKARSRSIFTPKRQLPPPPQLSRPSRQRAVQARRSPTTHDIAIDVKKFCRFVAKTFNAEASL